MHNLHKHCKRAAKCCCTQEHAKKPVTFASCCKHVTEQVAKCFSAATSCTELPSGRGSQNPQEISGTYRSMQSVKCSFCTVHLAQDAERKLSLLDLYTRDSCSPHQKVCSIALQHGTFCELMLMYLHGLHVNIITHAELASLAVSFCSMH